MTATIQMRDGGQCDGCNWWADWIASLRRVTQAIFLFCQSRINIRCRTARSPRLLFLTMTANGTLVGGLDCFVDFVSSQ